MACLSRLEQNRVGNKTGWQLKEQNRDGGRSLVYKFLPLLDRIDLSQTILWNLTEQAGFTGFFFVFSVSE